MRYLTIENGILRPKTGKTEIDTAKYRVVEEQRRFSVSQDDQGSKFLIDVGFRENNRVTIVCESMVDLIHALALVRAAFPATKKRK